MQNEYKYDVVISFAEEDRNAALALALAFEIRGLRPYYYPDNKAETLGNLKENLNRIYFKEARYAVALISNHYLNRNKKHVQVEMNAILTRMKEEKDIIYLIPVRLTKDLTLTRRPLFKGELILEWEYKPKEIVDVIHQLHGSAKLDNVNRPMTAKEIHNLFQILTVTNHTSDNQTNTLNSSIRLR